MNRAVLLCLPALAASAPATAQELVRGPYLQRATPTEMTVVWRTDAPTAGQVRYGPSPADLSEAITTPGNRTDHQAVLGGLEPGQRYCYAIFGDDGRLAGGDDSYCFRTAPAGPAPFRFWVVGDSGTATGKQGRVRDAMLVDGQGRLPDVYLHVGDMAYSSGTDEEFTRKFFGMYPRVLRAVPTFPAIGNHEGNSSDSLTATGPYYEAYVLPTEGESGGLSSGTEAYYSWDWGDVHFVALESHRGELRTEDAAMLAWLRMDLEATDKTWVVAYFHHPPYTKGSHDSDTEIAHIEMRERVIPILEAHGVDFVFGGHSHIYERSHLAHGAYDTPTTRDGHLVDDGDGRDDRPYHKAEGADGALYVVAGHGGTNVSRDGSTDHPLMAFTELINGTVVVDVEGATMRARNVRIDGVVSDDVRLMKGAALQLLSPEAGADAVVGATVEVRWLSRGGDRTIDVAFSVDDGASWTTAGEALPDTRAWTWTVPDLEAPQVRLRVSDHDAPELAHARPLSLRPSGPEALVTFGERWRYNVGEAPANWADPAFDDRRWVSDEARFGACACLPWEVPAKTFLAEALDASTVYFRRTFDTTEAYDRLELSLLYEVGVVVHVDGQEVLRRHVDDDAPDARAAATGEGIEVESLGLEGLRLEPGRHVVAVALKRGRDTGVNLSFDLRLQGLLAPPPPPEPEGCGCRASPSGAPAALVGLALLGLWASRRRRR